MHLLARAVRQLPLLPSTPAGNRLLREAG